MLRLLIIEIIYPRIYGLSHIRHESGNYTFLFIVIHAVVPCAAIFPRDGEMELELESGS